MKEVVHQLIQRCDSSDPFQIADCLGIHTLFCDIGTIRGFYTKKRREQFIVISTRIELFRQRVVCAHELGHAILHPDLCTPFYTEHTWLSNDKFEYQANLFATELILSSFSPEELEGFGVEQIAILTGLPVRYLLDVVE